jgi:5-methylcytosine-specific restriction enzyme A
MWLKDPRCNQCRRFITLKEAIRDHVIPLAEGGVENATNEQLLCPDCDRVKTQAEALRGRAR